MNIENFKSVKDNVKDNVRGTFNTLAKAAQKLQKQISTDDVNTTSNQTSSDQAKMPGKTQSQIELRENVSDLTTSHSPLPMGRLCRPCGFTNDTQTHT